MGLAILEPTTRGIVAAPNWAPQLVLPFHHELIIDNFAGGGGTSTGLESAFGRPVDVAINHDPVALAMHALNHPHTLHLCESVWEVDPIEITKNQPVGLVWLSPDCKHFSKAKGGTPVEKHIRGLAWVALRWAAKCRPRLLAIENVEEFQSWGPLLLGKDGKLYPDPNRRGETFKSFVRQLRGHGYQVEWRELRACDNGAPTIRKRLFLLARRDGLPICWPEQTHAANDSPAVLAGRMAPYRMAADCIDFSLPADSIFDRKKPLVEKTLRRVAKGLWRHVLSADDPYIIATDSPKAPFLTEHANSSSQRTMSAKEPLRTICAQIKGGHFSVVAPVLSSLRGTSEAHLTARSVADLVPTVTAGGNHHALIAAHLVSPASEALGQDAGEGEGKVLSLGFMEQANGGFYDGAGHSLKSPVSTITSAGSNQRLVSAYLVKYYSSGGQWQALNEPMHTLPTKARMGLVQVEHLPADHIAPEHLCRARKCAQLLHQHLPEHFPVPADVVVMGGWVLVDITLRMLKPRELYLAQGFPASYKIHEIPKPHLLFKDGVQVANPLEVERMPLPEHAQIRMCGNSVSPIQAEALIAANIRHEAAFFAKSA